MQQRPSSGAPPSKGPSQSPPRDAVRAGFSLSTHHVFSALVVLLVLVLQFLAPRLPHELLRFAPYKASWEATHPAVSYSNPLYKAPPVCPRPSHQPIHRPGTFNKKINRDTARSMALADQAKRVADEFGFGPDAVNKAVKEFIREMGESLATCIVSSCAWPDRT